MKLQKEATLTCKYYVMRAEMTEEEFLRSAYVMLSAHPNTPLDVLSITTLGEVKKEYYYFAYLKADANVSYSAMVGKDREVKYTDSYGKKQTKTVTDWQPITGAAVREGEAVSALWWEGYESFLSYEYDGFAYLLRRDNFLSIYSPDNVGADIYQMIRNGAIADSAYAEWGEEDFETEAPCEVSVSDLNELRKACVRGAAEQIERHLTGDRIANYDYTGSVCEEKQLESWVAPYYYVEASYGEQKAVLSAVANNCFHAVGVAPLGGKDEVKKEVNRRTKRWLWLSVWASAGCALLSLVLSFFLNLPWLYWLLFGMAAVCAVVYLVVKIVVTKTVKTESKDEKKRRLNEFLQKKGMRECSDEEFEKSIDAHGFRKLK